MKRLLFATTALVMLIAWPAHAGPLAAALPTLVTAIGGGLTTANIVLTIGGIVASSLLSALTAADAPKIKGTKQEMENGADKPPKFVLGTYGTPGHFHYHNSYSNERNIYVMVSIVSAMPVTAFGNLVNLSGETAEIDFEHPDADGFCPVIEYEKFGNKYCEMKFYTGGQTTADPWLVETFGDDPDWPWLEDMIVKGCAYVITRNLYSRKGVWAGNPTFIWTLKGMALYDPRRDSSVGGSGAHRWNDPSTWGGPGDSNPVIQKYNIIRGISYNGEWFWGGNAEAYRLPLEYVFAAANAADVTIEKKNGDIIKTFETGMEIGLDEKPSDVIKDIDRCTSSYTTEYGGTYKFFTGAPGLSVMTITDEDWLITEKGEDDPFRPVQETYNSAVATFPDPHAGWAMDAAPLYQDADFLAADDGQEQVLDLQLPYATEHNQVQRVLRTAIKDGRSQLSHKGVLPPIAFILEPHDRISYISKREGYHGDGVDFLVGVKAMAANVNQQVSIRSINPDAHIWLKEMELDHTVGPTKPIRRGALDLPFTVTPDWTETEHGKDKPAFAVSWAWAAIDLDVDKVLWRVRRQGTTKVIANGTIHDLEDGEYLIVSNALHFKHDYEVQFYPVPISHRDSAWMPWQPVTAIDLSKPDAPELTVRAVVAPDGTPNYYLEADWPSIDGEVTYKVAVTRVIDEDHSSRHVYPIDESRWSRAVTAGDHFIVEVATKASDGGSQSDWSDPSEITIEAIDGRDVSFTKTVQRSKHYSGGVVTVDNGFLTAGINNERGAPVKISWKWLLSARYQVADADARSAVTLKATLWKRHGSGVKQKLQTVRVHVAHAKGNRKVLKDSANNHDSKVFIDQHPKKGEVTTYGVDVLYKGAGAGTHRATLHRCALDISFNRR